MSWRKDTEGAKGVLILKIEKAEVGYRSLIVTNTLTRMLVEEVKWYVEKLLGTTSQFLFRMFKTIQKQNTNQRRRGKKPTAV